MDDDGIVAGLGVGFTIDTGGSFGEVEGLVNLMQSAEGKLLRNAAAIEQATSGMVKLAGPTVSVKSFSNAATLADRDLRILEKTGYSLGYQLERQAKNFGLNRDQALALRAETIALRLAEEGRTAQAEALREKLQALQGLQAEAAQKALREAQAVRDAAAAHAAFEAAARRGMTALREEEAAAARDTAALQRLRDILDPAGAAQAKLNAELAEARRLLTAAGASSEQLARAQTILTQRANGVAAGTGQMRSGMQQLSFQLNDVAVGFAAGTPPMVIFAQQSGQVIQALGLMSNGAKGVLGILGGPWGMVLTSALVVLSPFVAKLWEGGASAEAMKKAAEDLKNAEQDLDQITGHGIKTQQQKIILDSAIIQTQLNRARVTRETTRAELEQALATAQRANAAATGGRALNYGGNYAVTNALADIERLQKALADNNKAIAETEQRLRAAGRPALLAQVVAMTDKNAVATKRLTDQQTLLNQAYDQGRIGDPEYVKQALALQRQIDAIANSDKAAAAAKREHAKEMREAKKAQDELRGAYEGFLSMADPDRAALAQYRKDLEELRKVAIAFKFDEATLAQFQAALREKMMRERGQWVELATIDIKLDIDTSKVEQLPPVFRTLQDDLDDLSSAAERLGISMQDAFGRTGGAVSDVLSGLVAYGRAQKVIDDSTDEAAVKRQKSYNLQLDSMIGLTAAARGLFKEHSAGYRAMVAAEQVLTAIQLARTAVDVAGGAARMFGQLGIFAFPAVAAMLGVMASLGFSKGGSGGGYHPETNSGTGTVFGDSSAKSDSIKRSLDLLADLDNENLVVARQMASSLKAIENNIGGLTNLVIRLGGTDGIGSSAAVGINTGFNSSIPGFLQSGAVVGAIGAVGAGSLALMAGMGALTGGATLLLAAAGALASKVPIIGDILGGIGKIVGGLFGTKVSVVGQGIFGDSQSLADIESLGFSAQSYADIKKKKKTFGITTSTKYSTSYGDLDDSLESQFGKLILSFADAIKLASGPLGLSLDDIEAKLAGFTVDIGKIDLKDLSGEEIQEKLTAVFGALGDKMAAFAVGGLEQFQKVGEGYLETLVRVASTVETVTSSLQLLGLSAQSLGTDASMAIADMFGGASEYQQAAGRYFEAFYSDSEQAAAKTAALGKVFDSLGVVMPESIAAYRSLVEAQDLTSAAGQALYAQLIQLAPAFADVVNGGEGGGSSAASILRERQDLEKQLLEMQGDTAALRAMELAQMDPSNRALQERIYALRDEASAASAAAAASQAIINERAGLQRQLLELNGDTAAIREMDLSKVDESNRALLQEIWAKQDAIAAQQAAAAAAQEAQRAAEEAARAADQLRQAWTNVADGIMDEVKRIRGSQTALGGGSVATLQAQFDAATAAARGGNQDAASSLPEISRALLEAAAAVARDKASLDRISGITAASLEETYRRIMGVSTASQAMSATMNNASSPASWWQTSATMAAATPGTAQNDTLAEKLDRLTAEVAAMRQDNNDGNAAIAEYTGDTAKVMKKVNRQNPQAITIVEAAA